MIKRLIYAMRTRTMRNAGNAHNLQWFTWRPRKSVALITIEGVLNVS